MNKKFKDVEVFGSDIFSNLLMKKVLVLVASMVNLPVIKAAKELGYYVITCDNIPSNPGHQIADENLYIDVYDSEAIYHAVKNKNIEAVVSFVSSHGLNSASYISEKLDLPGYSTSSLTILNNKSLFRSFLREMNLNYPTFQFIDKQEQFDLNEVQYPVIVKPVDRGGSLGVGKATCEKELLAALDDAKSHSGSGRVIVEEFLDNHISINGDCIVHNGKLSLTFIGDYIYNSFVSNVLPLGTLFPSIHDTKDAVHQLQEIVSRLQIPDGILNFEAIIQDGRAFIIEINPRPSGNFLWKLMGFQFDVDVPQIYLKTLLKEEGIVQILDRLESNQKYYAYNLIYALEDKIFNNLALPAELSKCVKESMFFLDQGMKVKSLKTLYDRVGLALMEFEDRDDMNRYLRSFNHFKI